MKTLTATLALSLAAMAAPARADEGGACHFHGSKPAMAETVSSCANQRKAQLIKQGKLDASWASVKAGAPEQVDGKKGKEWKLTFHNAAASDKAKQTLYMFYTLPGNFIAANFTGQ
jgi:Family of unknown function (DUF6488)